MSYILDALRRADAEREREAGGVPTLQSQPRPALRDDDDERPAIGARPAWLLPAAGAGVLALVAAGWLLRGGEASPPSPPVAVTPAPPPADPLPPRADPVGVQAAAAPVQRPAPAPAPAPPTRAPAADRPLLPPPQAPVAAAPARPAVAPAPAEAMVLRLDRRASPAPAVAAAPAAAASLPDRIPRLAELPDTVRRELPALSIGGSVHSPDPEARMVILNGQVRREGETVGNGLVLKRIRVASAVFEFRGQLFEMPF